MTAGLHERVEYAISVCGKGFILYRQAIILEYALLYSAHKIQKGHRYLVRISEKPKISNISKISERSEIPKIAKNSRPSAQDFGQHKGQPFGKIGILGNIRVPLWEVLELLEICAI